MVQFNTPHGHRGIVPRDEQVMQGTQPPTSLARSNYGLYSRDDLDFDIDTIEYRLMDNDTRMTVLDYQYWAEGAWKTQHGTYRAVERFSDKLTEEQAEVVGAIHNYSRGGQAAKVISELGDLLWCFSALASNGAADIDAGLKNRLFKYVSGTQWIVGNTEQPPAWREEAAKLSTKYTPITLKNVDDLIRSGFVPNISPVMNLFDPDDDEPDVHGHLLNLQSTVMAAQIMASRQYGREKDDSETKGESTVMPSRFEDIARELGELTASAFLEIAFLGEKVARINLPTIVSHNVDKVAGRVKNEQVDKSDKPRN